MTFREKLEKRRQGEVKVLRGALLAVVLMAALVFGAGFYESDGVLVEDSYTVQTGDVLREISEAYLEKNTYGRRYILEFEEGIHEMNPWIREQGGVIYPGQTIRINYWVKNTEGGEGA